MRSPRSAALALAALLSCVATSSRAVPIQYEISGRVSYTSISGPVQPGRPFAGSFFFDPDRVFVRWNIDGYKGYDFQSGAAGLQIDVASSGGVLRFGTQPGYVLCEVVDGWPYPGQATFDSFWLYGKDVTNFPATYRRLFTQLDLNLYSPSATLLSSTDLPAHLALDPSTYSNITARGGPNYAVIDYYLSFSIDHLALANRPPDCGAAVGHVPPILALDGGWAPVTIDGVTDPDGDPVTIAVTGVTQDEPVADAGARPTCPDALIDGGAAQVRMERSGVGNGRVYRVAFTASDGRGGTCDGAVTVCVPHDQGGGETCVNDGTSESSTDCGDISRSPEDLASARRAVGELRVARIGRRAWAFEFSLAEPGQVSLSVVDVAGRSVASLARSWETIGTHRLEWRADAQPAGVYFVRLRTPGGSVVRRFTVL